MQTRKIAARYTVKTRTSLPLGMRGDCGTMESTKVGYVQAENNLNGSASVNVTVSALFCTPSLQHRLPKRLPTDRREASLVFEPHSLLPQSRERRAVEVPPDQVPQNEIRSWF